MKGIIKSIFYGMLMAVGFHVGAEAYTKLRDPYERGKLKNKFVKVKNAIFSKEES